MRLTYDSNGNVLTKTEAPGRSRQFVYDAWNRLVGVVQRTPSNASTEYPIARYSYNGLDWRVQKVARAYEVGAVIDNNAPWQRRDFFYSAEW